MTYYYVIPESKYGSEMEMNTTETVSANFRALMRIQKNRLRTCVQAVGTRQTAGLCADGD